MLRHENCFRLIHPYMQAMTEMAKKKENMRDNYKKKSQKGKEKKKMNTWPFSAASSMSEKSLKSSLSKTEGIEAEEDVFDELTNGVGETEVDDRTTTGSVAGTIETGTGANIGAIPDDIDGVAAGVGFGDAGTLIGGCEKGE